MKTNILVMNAIAPEGLRLLGEGYEAGPSVADPVGILVRSSPVDTDAYPWLLAVARAGAGVNNITVAKATERGICIFNTPGANANAVAELVFVMLGLCARNIHRGAEFCHGLASLPDAEIDKRIEADKENFRGFELAGKTLGVVGLGKIGVKVANGGASRRMRVVGFDPYPSLENIHALSPEVTLARSMAEVTTQADIITLHVPLGDKTRGLVNAALVGRLKRGTILVNFARGPVAVEADVLAALDSGQLAAYITDFPTHATLNHSRVINSPHLGASTGESEEQCATMAAKSIKAYLEYGTVSHSVNFPTAESIPAGNVHTRLIMINRDIPGMIGFASQIIGASGINIASYLNESNGAIGYNIIDLESPIQTAVLDQILANRDVIRLRVIPFAHGVSSAPVRPGGPA